MSNSEAMMELFAIQNQDIAKKQEENRRLTESWKYCREIPLEKD